MNKTYEELEKEKQDLLVLSNALIHTKYNIIKIIEYSTHHITLNKTELESIVSKIDEEYTKNNLKCKEIIEQIKTVREACKHNFVYSGHDSHCDWYECTRCGINKRS